MISTDISKAADLLKAGEVIGLPTETVYGLAGNIFNETAIRKIFSVKQRPFYNPLIVHLAGIDRLDQVAKGIPGIAIKLAEKFWPGPLTLLLQKQSAVPDLVTAGKTTVAVRVPDHRLALALLKRIDFPLAAPSANPFGCISPTTAKHVDDYFGDNIPLVLDGGPCRNGVESTIIGFNDGEAILYRHGAIPMEEIEKITGKLKVYVKEENAPDAPGMLSKHYSPRTPTILTDNIQQVLKEHAGKKMALLLFNKKRNEYDPALQWVLSPGSRLEEAASNLYAMLHTLDELKVDLIICEKMKEEGLGITMNDRLVRASVESLI
ncbi:MAG: threonylcarbamoyl-AMP synthase [Chitinophagaceae bacterium]|nr:threonylcarbamoyl-AMP synthase [Chitinophagaceae bacterium]